MRTELAALAVLTLFFSFAWIPAAVGRIQTWGIKWMASNRDKPATGELPYWVLRCDRAHNNLKDNFPAFAVTIILLGILGKYDSMTQAASIIFIVARFLHFFVYAMGFPLARFLSFAVGVVANTFLVIKLF